MLQYEEESWTVKLRFQLFLNKENKMNKKFTDLEKNVIKKLLEKDTPEIKILRKQFKNASVSRRKFTGSGFFTFIYVPKEIERITNKDLTHLGNVYGEIDGIKNGVDFILFISNGVIHNLECSVYGDEEFPKKIENYVLHFIDD